MNREQKRQFEYENKNEKQNKSKKELTLEDLKQELENNNAPRYETHFSKYLKLDLNLQNTYDMEIVNLIINTFTLSLLQPLEVSYRDGEYHVIDGKHRLTSIIAIENKYKIKIKIPCWVHYGLTEKEEKELFVNIAENRRKMTKMEILKASYDAGNLFSVNFVNAIQNAGFIFDYKTGSKNGRMHLLGCGLRIYEELGAEKFQDFLHIMYMTWNGNSQYISQDIFEGFYNFYKVYRDYIDLTIFSKRLSLLTIDELKAYVGQAKHKEKWRLIGRKIFQKYNKNKRMYTNNILHESPSFYME